MANLAGKIAAGVTVLVLLVGGVFIVTSLRDIQSGFPLEVIEVTETLDSEDCRWSIRLMIRNDSTEVVEVERIGTVLNRRRVASLIDLPPLSPGETAETTLVWNARTSTGCPPSASEINHNRLTLKLNNDRMVSHGF